MLQPRLSSEQCPHDLCPLLPSVLSTLSIVDNTDSINLLTVKSEQDSLEYVYQGELLPPIIHQQYDNARFLLLPLVESSLPIDREIWRISMNYSHPIIFGEVGMGGIRRTLGRGCCTCGTHDIIQKNPIAEVETFRHSRTFL